MTAGTIDNTRSGPSGPASVSLRSSRSRIGERIILGLLFTCGAISILTTLGIVFVLFRDALAFFGNVSIVDFLTDTAWQPFGGIERGRFGVLPLLLGTLLVTGIAMAVAVPLGVGSAMYLSNYAPARVRGILKPVLEVLAGVPTIVLGFFALTFMTPLLQALLSRDNVNVYNAASAGIVMGIMIIPTIASLSEDAMSAVPAGLRESAYGLGATRRQVVVRVVFPAALSGIVAAVILGFGRAIGETMIVAIAAGNQPSLTLNPLNQIQAMTAYIVQAVGGEQPRGSLGYESIFAVGALLFIITFSVNILAQRFVRRFREVY
ncbi:MAG: phosphate ABC transporter permease subunit PstC [Egibacteraceae bacterium]